MGDLEPAQIISGVIDRISRGGSGMLDYGGGEIRIGPVKPESVGTEATAVVYNNDFALCLTESARAKHYDNTFKAMTKQLVDDPPEDCPSPGDVIDVPLDNVNSSGHGNAEYKGIRVRVRHTFATDQDVTTDEPTPVKIVRIEPDKIVASAILSLVVRDSLPDVGDRFSSQIAHRSHSERGLVESFADGIINVGPITDDAVGQKIDAVMLDNKMAYCLSSGAVSDGYQQTMQSHITDEALEESDELSNIFSESVPTPHEKDISDSATDIDELRRKAEADAVEEVPENASTTTQTTQEYTRSQTIVRYVKSRADGTCEGCGEPAPFTSKTGEPYLHAHHIHELSEGGTDTPDTVIALCPNCHFRVHHGEDGEEYNQELLEIVQRIENN